MVPKGVMVGICSMVVVAALLSGGTTSVRAQTLSECTQVLTGMVSCLDYVSENKTAADKPTQACCLGLATVVRTQVRCLCLIVSGGGAQLGVRINTTRALDLPRLCNVQTPPPSECNNHGPAMAPMPPPPTAQTGSRATPSSGYTPNTIDFGRLFAATLLVFIASADFIKIF